MRELALQQGGVEENGQIVQNATLFLFPTGESKTNLGIIFKRNM